MLSRLGYAVSAVSLALSCQNQDKIVQAEAAELKSSQQEELKNGWLTQWDNEARKDWYLTPQGSNLVVYDIFRSLPEVKVEGAQRVKTGRLLSERAVMEKFGFVFPTPKQAETFTKDGLPFGLLPEKPTMSVAEYYIDKDTEYLGYSCAACHTGEANIVDKNNVKKRYVIDGGQPFLNQAAFFKSLYLSLTSALQDLRTDPEGVGATAFKQYYKIKQQQAKESGSLPLPEKEAFLKKFGYELLLSSNRLARVIFRGSTKPSHHGRELARSGPGRNDAVTNIFNALFGDMLDTGNEFKYPLEKVVVPPTSQETAQTVPYRDNDINVLGLDVPVSIPVVWDIADLECVQHNCLASSPLIRNIGEAIGVFGYAEINPDRPNIFNYKEHGKRLSDVTTVKVGNVVKLEESLKTIKSPAWPSSLLGELDAEKVKAGQKLFEENCNSCHANPHVKSDVNYTEENAWGKRLVRVAQVPYDEVGTDPLFIEKHGPRTAEVESVLQAVPGVIAKLEKKNKEFQGKYPYPKEVYECLAGKNPEDGVVEYKKGEFLELKDCDKLRQEGKGNTIALLSFVTTAIAEGYLDENFAGDLEAQMKQHAGHTYGKFFAKPFYRARPLTGVAFTGPYLHNGSVSTLWELLNPELRKDSFEVGSIDYKYDAEKPYDFGFANQGRAQDKGFVIDTSIPGNQNIGHTYGSELSKDEKIALIEYLKSL